MALRPIAVMVVGLVDFNGNPVTLNSKDHANPNEMFRYDSALDEYIFNLDAKGGHWDVHIVLHSRE